MKKWQREIIDELYGIETMIGTVGDITAISTRCLIARTQANQQVAKIISATFYEQDKDKAKKLIDELELLRRWNFPDKNGRLSAEEKQLNKKLEAIAEENNLDIFFR